MNILANDVIGVIISYFERKDDLYNLMVTCKWLYKYVKYGDYFCNIVWSVWDLFDEFIGDYVFEKYHQIINFNSKRDNPYGNLDEQQFIDLDKLKNSSIRKILNYCINVDEDYLKKNEEFFVKQLNNEFIDEYYDTYNMFKNNSHDIEYKYQLSLKYEDIDPFKYIFNYLYNHNLYGRRGYGYNYRNHIYNKEIKLDRIDLIKLYNVENNISNYTFKDTYKHMISQYTIDCDRNEIKALLSNYHYSIPHSSNKYVIFPKNRLDLSNEGYHKFNIYVRRIDKYVYQFFNGGHDFGICGSKFLSIILNKNFGNDLDVFISKLVTPNHLRNMNFNLRTMYNKKKFYNTNGRFTKARYRRITKMFNIEFIKDNHIHLISKRNPNDIIDLFVLNNPVRKIAEFHFSCVRACYIYGNIRAHVSFLKFLSTGYCDNHKFYSNNMKKNMGNMHKYMTYGIGFMLNRKSLDIFVRYLRKKKYTEFDVVQLPF